MSKPTSNLPPFASSSTEQSAAVTELAPLIQELKAICDNCDKQTFASQQFLTATESLLRLRHTFLDNDRPREAQEAFRHLNGFETLLQLVKKLSHLYEPTELSAEERRSLLTLYKDALAVLAESLKGNFGNRRYFARRISGGGTAALQ
ncbi:beige protein-like 1 [Aspergillus fumigatus]